MGCRVERLQPVPHRVHSLPIEPEEVQDRHHPDMPGLENVLDLNMAREMSARVTCKEQESSHFGNSPVRATPSSDLQQPSLRQEDILLVEPQVGFRGEGFVREENKRADGDGEGNNCVDDEQPPFRKKTRRRIS